MPDLSRLRALPRRPREVWQGGLVRLPMWITPPDEDPHRPWGSLWVSLGTGKLHMGRVERRSEATAGQTLDAFAEFALDPERAGYLPERIEVTGDGVAPLLGEVLGPLGIGVVERERLRGVEHVLEAMERETSDRDPVPGVLEPPGVTVERVAAFADAARIFFEAAPWKHLSNADLVRVEEPRSPSELRHLMVLGAGGREYGLLVFDAPSMHDRLLDEDHIEGVFDQEAYVAVFFGGVEVMPLADSALFEDRRMPVAGREAYPWAMRVGPKRRLRRLDPRALAFVEAALRALAATSESEIDSGRWSRVVPSFDGGVRMTLALPDLVDPEAEPRRRARPVTDRRVMERTLAEISRCFDENPAGTMDEINEILRERFTGRIDDLPSTASTPLEKAQDLCYEAFGAHGRRRVLLARRALGICPDCADAYVILAEQTGDPEEEHRLYREGVAAGERALGPERLSGEGGGFWADVGTRPFMRAVMGLAYTHARRGDKDEAVALLQRLLDLNPEDNQGVRYPLAGLLLETGRLDEAERLIEAYEDDAASSLLYARALLLFRREGDSAAGRRALREAVKKNPHVPALLADSGDPLPWAPSAVRLGGVHEAAHVAEDLRGAWRGTPGAAAWVERHAGPPRRR